MLLVTGIPSVAYTILASYDVHARWPYVLCLLTCFVGGILCFFRHEEVLRIRCFAGTGEVGNCALGNPCSSARFL